VKIFPPKRMCRVTVHYAMRTLANGVRVKHSAMRMENYTMGNVWDFIEISAKLQDIKNLSDARKYAYVVK